MSTEQMKILELLEAEKITSEEATKLLESLKTPEYHSGGPSIYEQTFEETVPVGDETEINLTHSHGSMTITGWDREEVRIEGKKIVRAVDQATARMFAEQMQVGITSDQHQVMVRTQRPEPEASWQVNERTIHYELHAPHRFNVVLRNAHGRTGIEHFDGTVDVDCRHGELRIEDIGNNLSIRHEHGHVESTGIRGDAEVRKIHGDFRLKEVEGALKLRHEHGHAYLEKIGKEIDGTRRHGNLEIADAGDNVRLEQEHGHLQLYRTGGNVEITRRHGNSEIEDVQGSLNLTSQDGHVDALHIQNDLHIRNTRGNTSVEDVSGTANVIQAHGQASLRHIRDGVTVHNRQGHIEVVTPSSVAHPYELTAKHGNVLLLIPEDAQIDLSARSEHGHIQSTLPLNISKQGHMETVKERLHNGEIPFEVSTHHGSIQIERQD